MNAADQQRYEELLKWSAAKAAAEAVENAKAIELSRLVAHKMSIDARCNLLAYTVGLVLLLIGASLVPSKSKMLPYAWALFCLGAFAYVVNGMIALEMKF